MRTMAYVANADSHDISVFALDGADGDLHEVERFAVGGTVMPLAASSDGRFLYASIRSEPYRVLSLAIDPASGRLRAIGSAALPASMCWISTDRRGRFLLGASYGGSRVTVSPIGADGVVREAQQVVQTEANAHAVQVDPSNRHAFATCLGGGVVRQWHFDADTGRLSDNEFATWRARPGAGPRHFAFDPHGPFVYLLNELDASVDMLCLDPAAGTLSHAQSVSAWPEGATGAPWAADIHATPDGRFLYASERRTSTLVSFSIDRRTGRLTLLATVPTEAEPRGFAITADGRFLLAAGQASHRIARYAIDAVTGLLKPIGITAAGLNPNWVTAVDLPG